MKEYCFDEDNYFVICSDDEKYDTYFQQYVIGCMYAVIGMRYHSNIFSAKMGTPYSLYLMENILMLRNLAIKKELTYIAMIIQVIVIRDGI